MNVVFDELLTNIIPYAYPDKRGSMSIRMQSLE